MTDVSEFWQAELVAEMQPPAVVAVNRIQW